MPQVATYPYLCEYLPMILIYIVLKGAFGAIYIYAYIQTHMHMLLDDNGG